MTIDAGAGVVPEFTLGDRLRKARELTGLDQGPFGKELDVSRATISNSERGESKPTRIVMRQWALRTGVPLEWLETGQVPSNNGPGPDGEVVHPPGLEPGTHWFGAFPPDLRLVVSDAA